MKAGEVVYIRVPPADVMTCIDLVRQAGVYTEGMSLASCIRLALSGLCEAARQAGQAPTRDGFEYNDMVYPFLAGTQGRKLAIAASLNKEAMGAAFTQAPQTRPPAHNVRGRVQPTGGIPPAPKRLSEEESARLDQLNEMWYRAVMEGKVRDEDEWARAEPALGQELMALRAKAGDV